MDEVSEIAVFDGLRVDSSDEAIRRVIQTVAEGYQESLPVTVRLARLLAESGEFIPPQSDVSSDLASTGGISSLSTLLTPLYLRAAGAIVPKLGVPGRPAGGVDCLAQIPGYRINLSKGEIVSILRSGGYAHFLANGDMAPLDGRMFALRQEMGAQAVPTLVAASLLAKKVSVGVKFAGLEIRVSGHGNFGTTWEAAARNARLYMRAARLLGMEGSAVLTEGRFPYQPYIGRSEALVALHEILTGAAPPWLRAHQEHCRTLALVAVPQHIRSLINDADETRLRTCFEQNVQLQGGDISGFEQLVEGTKAQHVLKLRAIRDGFVTISLAGLRQAFVAWQKQFKVVEGFSDPVGLILVREPGEWVRRGDVIGTARAAAPIVAEVFKTLEPYVCFPAPYPVRVGMEAIDG